MPYLIFIGIGFVFLIIGTLLQLNVRKKKENYSARTTGKVCDIVKDWVRYRWVCILSC